MVAAPRYLALGIGWAGIYPPGSLGASSRRVGGCRELFLGGTVVWCSFSLGQDVRFAVGDFSSEVRHIGR